MIYSVTFGSKLDIYRSRKTWGQPNSIQGYYITQCTWCQHQLEATPAEVFKHDGCVLIFQIFFAIHYRILWKLQMSAIHNVTN